MVAQVKIPKVIVSDRIRMPRGLIPIRDLKERYVIELYDESKCGKCSNLPDRAPHNELCSECEFFHGVHRFFNAQEYKDGTISLPQADLQGVQRYLRRANIEHKWIDRRKDIPVETPFKFIGKLFRKGDVDDEGNPRADQRTLVKKWLKSTNGVIQAAPRSGKTVMATWSYSHLQVKTVIIADQRELLNQFYETACGVAAPRFLRGKMVPSPNMAMRRAATNIKKIQDRQEKPIIFLPDSYANLLKFIEKWGFPDILLVPYQSFLKDFSRVADIINGNYSMVVVDEQHGGGADGYLRFLASLDVKYRLSLSATPDRKDGRSKLTARVLGPVVAVSDVVTLKPVIEFYPVQAKPKTSHKSWVGAKAWQKSCKERNVEIVKMVFADLRKGHNVIIIPVEHKDHLEELVRLINKQAKINFKKRDENWPEQLALPYHSSVDRIGTLNKIDTLDKKGKVHPKLPTESPRVIVAILKMVRQGLDMRRPSMLYSIIPASAMYIVGSPMFYQCSFRVCTPYKKLQPVVRVFVDNVPMFASCASSILYNEVLPNSTIKKKKEGHYIIADYDKTKKMINARTQPAKQKQVKWW